MANRRRTRIPVGTRLPPGRVIRATIQAYPVAPPPPGFSVTVTLAAHPVAAPKKKAGA